MLVDDDHTRTKTYSERVAEKLKTDRIRKKWTRRTNAEKQQQKVNCMGPKETTGLKNIIKD